MMAADRYNKNKKDVAMTLMEAFKSSVLKESEHEKYKQISPESSSVEWMRHMRELRDKTLQADIALDNDTSEAAIHTFVQSVGSIDFELGRSTEIVADYISKHGARTYDIKGKALDGSEDIKAPLEISVLEDALTIYEHLRTENSQALVEALLIKYSEDEWAGAKVAKERFLALSGQDSNI